MFMCRGCVLLGFFVLAESVVMLSLMMMMRRGVVVSSRLVMMLPGRMLRWLRHVNVLLVLAGLSRMFALPEATRDPSSLVDNEISIE